MTSRRLSSATVQSLPTSVAIPAYDRAAITPGIVHLGAFLSLPTDERLPGRRRDGYSAHGILPKQGTYHA
jgi:hypothetical protein